MSDYDRKNVEVDKSNEARKPGISKMISEGGLGADKYYQINKHRKDETEKEDED